MFVPVSKAAIRHWRIEGSNPSPSAQLGAERQAKALRCWRCGGFGDRSLQSTDIPVALTLARSTQPITVAIFSQLRTFGSNIDIIAPATFVSLVIPLAVFFAFQRYFVQGLLAGSVK